MSTLPKKSVPGIRALRQEARNIAAENLKNLIIDGAFDERVLDFAWALYYTVKSPSPQARLKDITVTKVPTT